MCRSGPALRIADEALRIEGANFDGALARRAFGHILLIKPSSLGDIVHALPVLRGLRRRYPEARIDWLVARSCAGLLAGHPDLDDAIIFERKRFGRLGRNWSASVEFCRFLKSLRERRYDLVIDLQGLFRSGFLALASGAEVRLGFSNAREAAWIFYTHRLRARPSAIHAAEKNYAVARVLGFGNEPMAFDLAVRDEERHKAVELLAASGLPRGERFAAVLPGARWETKRWYPERFAEVLDRLAAECGLPGVLMGAADEREVCAAVAARCRSHPVNLAGQTGLREMTALLGLAAVVLCHDSAPMHLAAAQQRPLVCLLGPTSPERTGPYGAAATILRVDLPCSPCYLRKLSQCRFHHTCMQEITATAVTRAAAAVLQNTPAETDERSVSSVESA
ncbi:MAG: lipopolysaccharide heptosyltransferase II [Planctomycetota bacterium]